MPGSASGMFFLIIPQPVSYLQLRRLGSRKKRRKMSETDRIVARREIDEGIAALAASVVAA